MGDDFKVQSEPNGIFAVAAFVDTSANPDELKMVTDANPLPVDVSAGGGATEATLQAVENAVDGVEALLTTIDGRVDGLEALLTTIDGRVDGVESALTTLAGHVDTLETLLAPLTPGGNFTDTTATAGTPEQINGGNSQACRLVVVSNWSSSPIAVGFSNAVDVALKTGVQIPAGQSHPFVCTNTNQIWVDVTTNGDAYGGVWYT